MTNCVNSSAMTLNFVIPDYRISRAILLDVLATMTAKSIWASLEVSRERAGEPGVA